ncbi:hypothetical protein B6E66_24780 [Streptomyces maremycinicus]|nr:hypothetical protein B6E66_24780 [Streptomyces sp. B9173]
MVAERHGQLVGYARKRLRNSGVPPSWADPEDIVHNALAGVLACPEPVEWLRPYVFTAIRNEVRHAERRCRTGRGYASLDADVRWETAAGSADPCAAAELRLDLVAALTALPPQQRRAVRLNKELGLTQAQTARAMGAAPGTVATHVSRALVTLRVALGALATAVVLCGTAASWPRSGLTPVDPAVGGEAGELLRSASAAQLMALIVVGTVGLVASAAAVRAVAAGTGGGWRIPFRTQGRRSLARLRAERAEEVPEAASRESQGEAWHVRDVSGASAEGKRYRCPGCDQVIPSGVAHVVAWPRQDGPQDRRHWHKACWNARDRHDNRTAESTERSGD